MSNPFTDPEDSQVVVEAKRNRINPVEYNYTERDVILYNLGIGATAKELQWTYEGHDDFAALPTFGVIPQFQAGIGIPLDWLPNFNPVTQNLSHTHPHQPLFMDLFRRNSFTENNI